MKPTRVAVVLLLVAGCGGLLTRPGNDFPCDFSKPPGERDAVCSAGDVCSVENRCQQFRYEGPQFEGLPTFPDFSAAADAGTVLHPRVVSGPIDFIGRIPGLDALIVHGPEGSFRLERGRATREPFVPSSLDDVVFVPRLIDLPDGGLEEARMPDGGKVSPLVVGREPGGLVFSEGSLMNRVRDGAGAFRAMRLRSLDLEEARARIGAVAEPPTRVGLVRTTGPVDDFIEIPTPGAGEHLDLAPGPILPLAGGLRSRSVLALSTDGLRSLTDGGAVLLAAGSFPAPSTLAVNRAGSVVAVLAMRPPQTISTFTITRVGGALSATSPWNECVPCTSPLAVTPGADAQGAFVEVLCGVEGLRRVRGAGAAPGGACTSELVPTPFDHRRLVKTSRRLVDVAVQDFASPIGFTAGGRDGQVWYGPTIGTAVPYFLDRVPQDVAQVRLPSAPDALVALTPVGLFESSSGRGFTLVAPEVTSKVEALVGDGQGWVVAAGGHLVEVVDLGLPTMRVRFGPQLVDGRGAPVSRPLRGEAVTSLDGGVVSMVIAADDSLYFVASPETAALPGQLGELTAQLTPEPSTFIRGLALERTPIGTNGVDRMRGYVVTSRNVYEFKLGGAPLRWTTTPLRLSGAEPVEVWFDNPRGGLARVGYRDGTIFSVPGGFQLSEALPTTDGGVPVSVLDYENLGGWPVALTTTGLFVARYDRREDNGRLDNRFPDGGVNKPMTWREVTLPNGARPWLTTGPFAQEVRAGKLQVVADPMTGTDRAYRRLFHLLVFTPTAVLEVGQHLRTNISAPTQ